MELASVYDILMAFIMTCVHLEEIGIHELPSDVLKPLSEDIKDEIWKQLMNFADKEKNGN